MKRQKHFRAESERKGKVTSIRLTEEQHKRIQKKAQARGMTVSNYIIAAAASGDNSISVVCSCINIFHAVIISYNDMHKWISACFSIIPFYRKYLIVCIACIVWIYTKSIAVHCTGVSYIVQSTLQILQSSVSISDHINFCHSSFTSCCIAVTLSGAYFFIAKQASFAIFCNFTSSSGVT